MNYPVFLVLHSLFRWVVLLVLFYILIQSIRCVKLKKTYSKLDLRLISVAAFVTYIQVLLGFILYFISPFITQFYSSPSTYIHVRETRFFSMEHSLMMLISIVIFNIGIFKSKKAKGIDKPRIILKWLILVLLIILLNIPWEFSALVHRPSLRWL